MSSPSAHIRSPKPYQAYDKQIRKHALILSNATNETALSRDVDDDGDDDDGSRNKVAAQDDDNTRAADRDSTMTVHYIYCAIKGARRFYTFPITVVRRIVAKNPHK